MQALTPDHVQRVLDGFALGLRVVHFEDSTFTSEDAARSIGCELGQIAKSMCLMVDGSPTVAVAAGDKRLSDAKIARHFSVGRKKVKIATGAQCLDIFGYPPGGVAPVGHRTEGVRVIIDETLSRWPVVYAAAGTHHDNVSLTFDQLITVTGGVVVDCVKE